MTINQQDAENLKRACCGNAEAMEFLALWSDYVNVIDDIVDENLANVEFRMSNEELPKRKEWARRKLLAGAERVCAMGALAIQLYSHPFYLKHLAALRQIALNCTNAYLDSVIYEKSGVEWKEQWSDHYRHFGAEMVIAVAGICGGWQQVRNVSLMLREICYTSHHDAEGRPD